MLYFYFILFIIKRLIKFTNLILQPETCAVISNVGEREDVTFK